MNQTVLITGAARGLGLALCKRYLGKGDEVLACVRGVNTAGLDELLKEYPDKLRVISNIDVGSDEVEKILPSAVSALTDHVDILINNAAIILDNDVELEDLSTDDTMHTININVLGALRVTRCILPMLNKGGKIVNISSEAGSNATNFRSHTYAYCMSKAALNRMSVILQKKVEPLGINVIVIQPGWMQTDMGGSGADHTPDFAAEHIEGVISSTEKFAHIDLLGKLCEW